MKRGIIATLLALAFVAYSCTVNEDPLPSGGTDNDGKVVAEPTATIEPFVFDDEAATKTVLSIDENTGANFTFECRSLHLQRRRLHPHVWSVVCRILSPLQRGLRQRNRRYLFRLDDDSDSRGLYHTASDLYRWQDLRYQQN